MRFVPNKTVLCERAHEWISLRLDGELSELAQKMLESHLARCTQCREFEAEVVTTTRLIRATPLERPEQDFAVPRGIRFGLPARRLAAVAAGAAVVGLGLAGALMPSGLFSAGPPIRVSPSDNSDLVQQKLLRATVLRPTLAVSYMPPGPQQS
jgi:anti-sigma factor RsiW